jgi:hypothetical protein
MRGRFGSGYVHASQFVNDDEAVRDFCGLWGVDESMVAPRPIRFQTGRNRRSWVGNCVSIGLSSCFLQPLESTAIYFITAAIYQLARHFPTLPVDPGLACVFNREIEFMFDGDCPVRTTRLTYPCLREREFAFPLFARARVRTSPVCASSSSPSPVCASSSSHFPFHPEHVSTR